MNLHVDITFKDKIEPLQKNSSRGVLTIFAKINRKTSVPESLF